MNLMDLNGDGFLDEREWEYRAARASRAAVGVPASAVAAT
jgi:hypothetical protein